MNQLAPPLRHLTPEQLGAVPEHRLTMKEIIHDLVNDGMIPPHTAKEFLIPARTSVHGSTHPLVMVAEQKWHNVRNAREILDLEVLTRWLAERNGMEYYVIDPLKIDVARVTTVMSVGYANNFKILPVANASDEVTIATAEPYQREWERELAKALRRRIRRVVANPVEIMRYLPEFYNLARFVKKAEQNKDLGTSGLTNFEQLVELGKTGQLDANDHHIVSLVDWLFQYAFEQRASDIHLEPRRELGSVRFRIDGVLHNVYQMPTTVMAAIVSRIKLLGRMDLVEKRKPQDGRIKTRLPSKGEIELRLSTMPTAFGEKLVMRIFDPEVLVRNMRELGFSDDEAHRWQHLTTQPHGIILVTGPTGSGKTTTLYSTLKQLATEEVNVCTVEDPIEMIEPSFNQMQVQPNIGLDFAGGVRTLLRQDPDIIMVGEIRDQETAEMAVQAALTGHLVLSTLHTNDAPAAITRLLEIGVPNYLISATVLGVLAQRLVRTLCPHCKEPGAADAAAWNALVAPWRATLPAHFYVPKGCLECRMTGFLGRIGIYEMLVASPAIRNLLANQLDVNALHDMAIREGLRSLRLSGALKVAAGLTTVEEVMKVVPSSWAEQKVAGHPA